MNTNSRFAVAIHTVTLLACRYPETLTSECLAGSVTTNPVVIRRILGDLRRAGLVESRSGNGGGWKLCKAPGDITLLDCYLAVREGHIFALPAQPANPHCDIGRAIKPELCRLFHDAENALEANLAQTTLAQVAESLLAQLERPCRE